MARDRHDDVKNGETFGLLLTLDVGQSRKFVTTFGGPPLWIDRSILLLLVPTFLLFFSLLFFLDVFFFQGDGVALFPFGQHDEVTDQNGITEFIEPLADRLVPHEGLVSVQVQPPRVARDSAQCSFGVVFMAFNQT